MTGGDDLILRIDSLEDFNRGIANHALLNRTANGFGPLQDENPILALLGDYALNRNQKGLRVRAQERIWVMSVLAYS